MREMQAMRYERHKHRQRIKEQIFKESAYAFDEKRRQRIQKDCRGADDDIIHIKVSSGHGKAKRA